MKSIFDDLDIGRMVHHKMPTESIEAGQTRLSNQENSLAIKVAQNNAYDMHLIVDAANDLAGEKALNDYERSLYESAKQYSDDPDGYQKNVTELTNEALANNLLQKKAYRIRGIQKQALGECLPFINENKQNKLCSDLTNCVKTKINTDLDKIKFLYANTQASPDAANGSVDLKSGNAELLIANHLSSIGSLINVKRPGSNEPLLSPFEISYMDEVVNNQIGCAVLTKEFEEADLGGKLNVLDKIKNATGTISMLKMTGPGSERFAFSVSQLSQETRYSIYESLKKKLVDSLTAQYTNEIPNKYFKDVTSGNIPLLPTSPLQQEAFEVAFNDIFQNELSHMFASGGTASTPAESLQKFNNMMDVVGNFVGKTRYVPKSVGVFSEAIKKYGNDQLFYSYVNQFQRLMTNESMWNDDPNVWGTSEHFLNNLGGLFWSANAIRNGGNAKYVFATYQQMDEIPSVQYDERQKRFEDVWGDKKKRDNYINCAVSTEGYTYFREHMEILTKKEADVPDEFKKNFKEIAKFYFCKTGDFTSSMQAAEFRLFHFGDWGTTESPNIIEGVKISRYAPNVFYGPNSKTKSKITNYCGEFFEKNKAKNETKPLGYYLVPDRQTYSEIESGSKSPSYLVMASYPLKDKRFAPGDEVQVRIGADVLGNKDVGTYEKIYTEEREAVKRLRDNVNQLNFHE